MPIQPGAAMPRLHLLDDWRSVLRRAWSIRLLILAGLLSGAEVALQLLDLSAHLPGPLLPVLSAIVTAGALVARLVAQREVAS